jgi:hypothetical protein
MMILVTLYFFYSGLTYMLTKPTSEAGLLYIDKGIKEENNTV